MGLDTDIEVEPGRLLSQAELDELSFRLVATMGRNLFAISPPGKGSGYRRAVEFARNEYNKDYTSETRLSIRTIVRYYGDGYERGPWPEIRFMILWCMQFIGGEVYYGPDEASTLVTKEFLVAMDEHYIECGNFPYVDRVGVFDAPQDPDKSHRCACHGKPTFEFGFGRGYYFHACHACGTRYLIRQKDRQSIMVPEDERDISTYLNKITSS